MKKISLTLLFYCVLGCLFYSCCKDFHRIVGSADFSIEGAGLEDSTGLHVITKTFYIVEHHEIEVAGLLLSDFGTQEAYATQPCDLWVINNILLDEVELYFDQALTLDTTTVPASVNVLADATFKEHIGLFHDSSRGHSSLTITFDSTFFNPPIFTNGLMNIRLVTKTENEAYSFESEEDVMVEF